MAKVDLLTAARVKSERIPGDYLDGRGLYLQVRNATSKSWLLKYSLNKKTREMGLGSAFDISLAKARDLRDHYREMLALNVDPLVAREAERAEQAAKEAKAITFRQAAERHIAANRAGWKRAKLADLWKSTLDTYAYPVIGDLSVQSIDTALVLKVIEPIWTSKPETAGRVRGRIETVLDGCKVRGEFVGENPARWKGHLEHSLPKKSKVRRVVHHPALPYAQVPEFMQELRSRDGVAAAALEFQILTVPRPANVHALKWVEIDRKAAVWTVAGVDMKQNEGFRQPLSEAALAVLERMEKIKVNEFVFPGPQSRRPLSDAAMAAVVDRMNLDREKASQPKWIDPTSGRVVVPHGFRSSFRDWAAERGYPDPVAEASLAHKVKDEVVAAYLRTTFFDLRKKLMADWATYVMGNGQARATVVALRA